MAKFSLTTDSDSLVSYDRTADGDEALLVVDYAIPALAADRTREGWQKTVADCAHHELETHEGLLREIHEELLDVLEMYEDGCVGDRPINLVTDVVIQELAPGRTCHFDEHEGRLTIGRGLFHDEWRVRKIRPETTNIIVLEVLIQKMLSQRQQLVRRIFEPFTLQAVGLDRCN